MTPHKKPRIPETFRPQLAFDNPVSVNRLYKPSRGRIVMSDEARAFKQEVGYLARLQWEGEPFEGALCVTYVFYGSKMDVDNGVKILTDALNGIAWLDDSQIVESHLYIDRTPIDDDPYVEVEIKKL